MLPAQKGPFPAKMSRPRSDRGIADNWRGLYGSARFSSMWRGAGFGAAENGAIRPNISIFAVFFSARMAACPMRTRCGRADIIEL